MPIDRNYACKFMQQWFKIKEKYSLVVEDKEKEYFEMAKCS